MSRVKDGLNLLATTRWGLTDNNRAFLEFSRLRINPSVIVHTGSILIVIKRVSLVSVMMMVLFSVAEGLLSRVHDGLNLLATTRWELTNNNRAL